MHYHSINGQINKEIAITDRAFNYGDGIFTTAKITHGKIEFLKEHIDRLTQACAILSIDFTQVDNLVTEITTVAQSYNHAVLKIIVTAGQGGRGYSRQSIAHSNVVISVHDVPEHYLDWQQHGINLGRAQFQLGLNPSLKGLKHLNRIEQVLIRKELDQSNHDDLIVSNSNNHVIEASAANVFWIKNDELFTSDLTNSGVIGIIRQQILALNTKTKVVNAHITELEQANSLFICNCIMGIVPVKMFQGRKLDIQPVKEIQANLHAKSTI